MANKNKATAPAAAETKAAPVERKIPIEKLRRSCLKLFGVTPSTFDGATVGRKSDEEFTVAEIGEIVKSWKDAPIRPAKKEGK